MRIQSNLPKMLLLSIISIAFLSCGLPPFNSELQGELIFLNHFEPFQTMTFENTGIEARNIDWGFDIRIYPNLARNSEEAMVIQYFGHYHDSNYVYAIQTPDSTNTFNFSSFGMEEHGFGFFTDDGSGDPFRFDFRKRDSFSKVLPSQNTGNSEFFLFEGIGNDEVHTLRYRSDVSSLIDGVWTVVGEVSDQDTGTANSLYAPANEFKPIGVTISQRVDNRFFVIGNFNNNLLSYAQIDAPAGQPASAWVPVDAQRHTDTDFTPFQEFANVDRRNIEFSELTGDTILTYYDPQSANFVSKHWNVSNPTNVSITDVARSGLVRFMFSTGDAYFITEDAGFLRKQNGEIVDLNIGRVEFLYEFVESNVSYVYFQSWYPSSGPQSDNQNTSITLYLYRVPTSELLSVLYRS
jgi:hypothetical protein